MQKDVDRLTRFELYKAPFREQMIEGIRAYNLKTKPLADKRISNVLIPLVRMVADSCITSMSAGQPSFNVRPRAIEDYPKVDILKPAIDQALEDTNFQQVQNQFLTDGCVMGTSGLEVATEWPQRKDENGNAVRDFSRPRIVIRPRSGMEMSFDPSLPGHHKKGAYHWQDRISKDAFDEEYKIVRLPDGSLKYKNTDCVKAGIKMNLNAMGMVTERATGMYDYQGIVLDHVQDPLQNYYRIYANNVPIYDIPLYMRRRRDGSHTNGDNALGDTRIAVWTNNDQFDDNDATHALYGGGEYWLMSGLNRMYQDFSNMMVDNYALANTFALHYKPGQGAIGGMDLDSTDFYSGMFINGELISTPFGEVQLKDFENVKNIIDEWCIFVTGVNFKSIVGEQGATAFEVATKIRAANKRYEYKLKKLEDTVYKKLGKLVVAAIFTTYTVDDFETVTGQDREEIARKFADGDLAEDDLMWGEETLPDGKKQKAITGLRHKTTIKIPGRLYREKLGKDGKRKLDGTLESTLSEDITKRGQVDSFIPAAGEYLLTKDYTERGQMPDVVVDTGTMIAGRQELELSDLNQLAVYAQNRVSQDVQSNGNKMLKTDFDLQKIDRRMTELLNFTPEAVTRDDTQNAEDAEEVEGIDKSIDMIKEAMKSNSPIPTSPDAQALDPQAGQGSIPAAPAPAMGAGAISQASALGATA